MTNGLTLVLLAGLPGSGKSTHTDAFIRDNHGYVLVSPDLMRAQLSGGDMSDQTRNGYIFTVLVPQYLEAAARTRQHVIFDSTAYRRKNRKEIIKMAKELGYRIIARVFKTPFEECVRRNETRTRVVPMDVLVRMRDGWQDPELTEGIDEIEVIEWTPPENPLDSAPQDGETQST